MNGWMDDLLYKGRFAPGERNSTFSKGMCVEKQQMRGDIFFNTENNKLNPFVLYPGACSGP